MISAHYRAFARESAKARPAEDDDAGDVEGMLRPDFADFLESIGSGPHAIYRPPRHRTFKLNDTVRVAPEANREGASASSNDAPFQAPKPWLLATVVQVNDEGGEAGGVSYDVQMQAEGSAGGEGGEGDGMEETKGEEGGGGGEGEGGGGGDGAAAGAGATWAKCDAVCMKHADEHDDDRSAWQSHVDKLFRGVDRDGNGDIDYDEFDYFLREVPEEGAMEFTLLSELVRDALVELGLTSSEMVAGLFGRRERAVKMETLTLSFEALAARAEAALAGEAHKKSLALPTGPLRRVFSSSRFAREDLGLSMPLAQAQVDELLACVDPSGGGAVTFMDFVRWVAPPRDVAMLRGRLLQILHTSFDGDEDNFYENLDAKGKRGELSKGEMVRQLQKHNLALSELEVEGLMAKIDGDIGDSDGIISLGEWKALLNGYDEVKDAGTGDAGEVYEVGMAVDVKPVEGDGGGTMRGKVSAVSAEGVVRMYTIKYDKGGKTEAEVPGTRLRSLGMIPMSVFTDHCKHRLKVELSSFEFRDLFAHVNGGSSAGKLDKKKFTDAARLCDKALAADLVCFSAFLTNLRDAMLNRMIQDLNASAESGQPLSPRTFKKKKGGSGWRSSLKRTFEFVDRDRSGYVTVDEFERFVFLLLEKDQVMKMIQDLINDSPPPYQRRESAMVFPPTDDADDAARAAAAAAAQRQQHYLYAVFKRYCKRLLDGLDNDGNGELSLEEFEGFLTEEPDKDQAEMPVVVVSTRFAMNQLRPAPPPWMPGAGGAGQSSLIRLLFSDLGKLCKKPIKNGHLGELSRTFLPSHTCCGSIRN